MMRNASLAFFIAAAVVSIGGCGKSVQLGPVPPGPLPGSTPTSVPTSPNSTPTGTPTVTPTGTPTTGPTEKCTTGKTVEPMPCGKAEIRSWCFVQPEPKTECKKDPSPAQQAQQTTPGCPDDSLETVFILTGDQGIQPRTIVVQVDGNVVPASFFSLEQDGVSLQPQDAGQAGSSILVQACVAPAKDPGKQPSRQTL
jgi:hypothetical protein